MLAPPRPNTVPDACRGIAARIANLNGLAEEIRDCCCDGATVKPLPSRALIGFILYVLFSLVVWGVWMPMVRSNGITDEDIEKKVGNSSAIMVMFP